MTDKLLLKEKITAVDLNIKELWDTLDPDQQKDLKGDFFILNRYISNVTTTDPDVAAHYILTVNEYYNKHWNDLQNHPKLLWMLLCMCNYNGNSQFFHEWISFNRKSSTSNLNKLLTENFPDMKPDEIELLESLMSPEEVKQFLRELGWTEKEIKKFSQ